MVDKHSPMWYALTYLALLITTNHVGGIHMADTNFLQRARCLHPAPEKVHNERFQEENGFFDPKDIVQVKYELLRSCEVEGSDIASASASFGFSRTTYYKVYEAFLHGGIPSLMGRPRGRPQPIKLNEIVLGYLIAEKAKNPKLAASKIVAQVMGRYHVQISERMIQHVWQYYGVSKKS